MGRAFKRLLCKLSADPYSHVLPQGGCIHDGTWQSAIYGFADSDKLRSLRKKFGYKSLPVVGARIKRRCVKEISH